VKTRMVSSPVIWLDDGSYLRFVTEETDTGEYGTWIGRYLPRTDPGKKQGGDR
jgi:hypothetical protein